MTTPDPDHTTTPDEERTNPVPYGFTTFHLAWLIEAELVADINELGPIVSMPEAADAVVDYLTNMEGVLIDGGTELTDAAKKFFAYLGSYSEMYWGILELRGARQPIQGEIDEQLAQWGIQYAIQTVPKVYFRITTHSDGSVFSTFRFGDELRMTHHEHVSDPQALIACELMDMSNPDRQWEPARIAAGKLPFTAISGVGATPPADDPKLRARWERALRSALNERDVPKRIVNDYINLLGSDLVARMEVVYSKSPTTISQSAATVGFYHPEGIVVMVPERMNDRSVWVRVEPGSTEALHGALKILHGAIQRRRLPLL